MSTDQSIDIDPVGMNIVSRIAPGSKFTGNLVCSGGILIQGEIEGDLLVTGGPVVLMQEGRIKGNTDCDQDAYLFGTIEQKVEGHNSEVNVGGAVFLAQTFSGKANITAAAFKTFEGAALDGTIRTINKSRG